MQMSRQALEKMALHDRRSSGENGGAETARHLKGI